MANTIATPSRVSRYTITIPDIDFRRFKGLARLMGWTFEKEIDIDETAYVLSNPKIMDSIREGEAAIAAGNLKTTTIEDLWK